MKNARPIFSVLVLCLLSVFTVVPVNAETLTLPQTFQYPGLTFSQPLTFTASPTIQPLSIEFTNTQPMNITPTSQPEAPAEKIVLPTPEAKVLAASTTSLPKPHIKTVETTPIPTPTPTLIPKVTTVHTSSGGLNADTLFSMVNSYRESKGLADFQKDDKTCSLAESRAPEVNDEIATGNMHAGLRARHLPYWNTENIISLSSEQAAFNWWINDTIHRKAIESNNTYSCVACSGYACAEEFTNYQPK